MELVDLFLWTHSGYHAGDVSGDRGSITDLVFGGLGDAQMRARPVAGVNSLIWLLWHMARTEDVAVNLVITAGSQVFDETWARRMNVERRDIGSGMTSDEVDALTASADVEGVRAYRSSVGRRTRDVVRALPPAAWDEIVGVTDTSRAAAEGALRGWRDGVGYPAWQGMTRGQRLSGSAGGHNVLHHGEAITIRGLGGFGV